MNAGEAVFVQLLQLLPRYEFRKHIAHYRGNIHVRSFSDWNQFIAMAFAQLKGRESLRNIEACLSSHREKMTTSESGGSPVGRTRPVAEAVPEALGLSPSAGHAL